jgi:hypothetical protein
VGSALGIKNFRSVLFVRAMENNKPQHNQKETLPLLSVGTLLGYLPASNREIAQKTEPET